MNGAPLVSGTTREGTAIAVPAMVGAFGRMVFWDEELVKVGNAVEDDCAVVVVVVLSADEAIESSRTASAKQSESRCM